MLKIYRPTDFMYVHLVDSTLFAQTKLHFPSCAHINHEGISIINVKTMLMHWSHRSAVVIDLSTSVREDQTVGKPRNLWGRLLPCGLSISLYPVSMTAARTVLLTIHHVPFPRLRKPTAMFHRLIPTRL